MLQVINGPTIQMGESLSDTVDCTGGDVVRIVMPAAWDKKAPLTFQLSDDGQTFSELYDRDGHALTINEVVPGASVIVPVDIGRAVNFARFRSGTEGNPDPQAEARVFSVVVSKTEKTVPVMVMDPKEGKPVRPRPKPRRKGRR